MKTGDPDETHAGLPPDGRRRSRWVSEAAGHRGVLEARYDAWADHYDGDVERFEGWCAPEAAAAAMHRIVARDALILDAGAGTGLVGQALARRGYRALVGADLSYRMLRAARAKGAYQGLLKADLTRVLPFADRVFDAVISVGTSGYLEGGVLEELVRIVRPAGHVLCVAGDATYEERGFASAQRLLEQSGAIDVLEVGSAFAAVPLNDPGQRSRVRILRRR